MSIWKFIFTAACCQGRLTLEEVEEKMWRNPRRILGLPEQQDTYIEVSCSSEGLT